MDFTTLTIELLGKLASIVGNYGWAIIALTIIVRLCLWPLNVSQQRSMRTMQTLQPKIKAIQDRYKNNPQVMQQKLMEFYKDHKFNPMGGCLPLLIQMPIFILLYSALMSPQFIQMAGNAPFYFVNRLDTTLRASAGISNDGTMGASKYDKFILGKSAVVYLPTETLNNVKISKPNQALEIQGDLVPGENIDFKVSLDNLDLKFSQLQNIEKADISITDINTKETELVTFKRHGELLIASVPSTEVEQSFHFDVLLLIVLFGITMFAERQDPCDTRQDDRRAAVLQRLRHIHVPVAEDVDRDVPRDGAARRVQGAQEVHRAQGHQDGAGARGDPVQERLHHQVPGKDQDGRQRSARLPARVRRGAVPRPRRPIVVQARHLRDARGEGAADDLQRHPAAAGRLRLDIRAPAQRRAGREVAQDVLHGMVRRIRRHDARHVRQAAVGAVQPVLRSPHTARHHRGRAGGDGRRQVLPSAFGMVERKGGGQDPHPRRAVGWLRQGRPRPVGEDRRRRQVHGRRGMRRVERLHRGIRRRGIR